jgi:cation:H+ antiporter
LSPSCSPSATASTSDEPSPQASISRRCRRGFYSCRAGRSLGVIIAGAHFFVDAVEHAAAGLGLPAGLIALVLAPLATELPEKFNSIFWMRDGKDTLALGNVTGAMMFQSTVPVAFGVLFTPWNLVPLDLFAVVLALASGGLVYLSLRLSGKLRAGRLMLGSLFYLAFVVGAVIAVL